MKTKIPNSKLFIFSTILFFGVFGMAESSLAASHYIRLGCETNGDGSTWECGSALNTIAGSHIRGDVYYISSGVIDPGAQWILDDSEDGIKTITFKKATMADHGTDTGWLDSLASGQTIIESALATERIIRLQHGYYVIDGSYGSGVKPDGYGILFRITNTGAKQSYLIDATGYKPSDLTVKYCAFVNFESCDLDIGRFGINNTEANLAVQHCLFRFNNNHIHSVPVSSTIENNVFYTNCSAALNHGEGIGLGYQSDNTIIRNNLFIDSGYGSGSIASVGSTNERLDGVMIYNNVFTGHQDGWIKSMTGEKVYWTNAKIYNNTVYSASGNFYCNSVLCSDNQVYNNLFYGANIAYMSAKGTTFDYNYYDSTCTNYPSGGNASVEARDADSLFRDKDNLDFRLQNSLLLPVNRGKNFSVYYTTDILGTMRPQGAAWDIGAYEYQSGSDNTAPSAPGGLTIK